MLERAELDLIDDGQRVGDRQQLVQLAEAEVRHADRPGVAALAGALHHVHAQVGPPCGQWMMYRST